MLLIAPEIPPVHKLDWDIRPNRFSDYYLIPLAPVDGGMNIPRQLARPADFCWAIGTIKE